MVKHLNCYCFLRRYPNLVTQGLLQLQSSFLGYFTLQGLLLELSLALSLVVSDTPLQPTWSSSEGLSPQVLLKGGGAWCTMRQKGDLGWDGAGSVIQMVGNETHHLINGAAPAAV